VESREEELNKDLGLGGRLAQINPGRMMNRDGTFNVVRAGLPFWSFVHPYQWLLTLSWPRFFAAVLAVYLATNVVFALGYLACGTGALSGATGDGSWRRFLDAFFFSVQTLATIGYGKMTPEGIGANLLVSVEALTGLLGFALATGLLFARVSRPTANIVFSEQAIVAPYNGRTALMLRIANGRRSELIEVEASVTLSRLESGASGRTRKFHQLPLERSKIMFLATQWVIVHPIDEASPLWGIAEEQFHAGEPEILVLLSATDDTFSQIVNTRSSYRAHEFVWGAKFRDIINRTGDSKVWFDLRRISEFDRVELG